ncbi:hypothetical protein, conserved [Eimeria tenella]|uniref:Uncharacterized protein n=1 Tax=Eimeria tenella TaxID=5802 RepID=U6L8F7_EIMTE|nr:hypothetical protein, conserved [Eimeria tenella]CDJ45468.1 hypothetical protein, conserved [Eimeria tenella]|eukprot:XP_013236214.1 hypothetical protein, conserved [Eimeria tenella]
MAEKEPHPGAMPRIPSSSAPQEAQGLVKTSGVVKAVSLSPNVQGLQQHQGRPQTVQAYATRGTRPGISPQREARLPPSIFSGNCYRSLPLYAASPPSRFPQLQRTTGAIHPIHVSSCASASPAASVDANRQILKLCNPGASDQRTEHAHPVRLQNSHPQLQPWGPNVLYASSSAARPVALLVAASKPGAPPLPVKIKANPSGQYAAQVADKPQHFQSLQKFREAASSLPYEPNERVPASQRSLANHINSRDTQSFPTPVFIAAASHGRAADSPGLLSNAVSCEGDTQRSNSRRLDEGPVSCCGLSLQPLSITQLFSDVPQPLSRATQSIEVDSRSAIRLLQDAEDDAAAVVLTAQEKSRALRERARAEAEAEGEWLRNDMEKLLETIVQKNKIEREGMRKLHAQREAETNAILARDKQENLAGTVSMVVDLTLKVDVQCPVEAIKLFCPPERLLTFRKKSPFQHHPSGELLLKAEDYITWDEEGRALLARDALRHRQSFGSFWTKHQSKVHSSVRPALLLKTPHFDDPLDRDINRRLPSSWKPEADTDFQPFQLPAFAASSPSSAPSEDKQDPDSIEGGPPGASTE